MEEGREGERHHGFFRGKREEGREMRHGRRQGGDGMWRGAAGEREGGREGTYHVASAFHGVDDAAATGTTL